MLQQHCHKTLHRAEWRTVNHHRTVLCIVAACVFELEAFRKVVVYLNRAELPAAAYCVANHEVELRAVERRLAEFGAGIESFFSTRLDDCVFGKVPVFVATYVLFRVRGVAQRNLSLVVFKLERLKYI